MGKKSARRKAFGPADYNQPTEPLEHLVLPPPEQTVPLGGWYSGGQSMPSPQAEMYPYPQGYAPNSPYEQYPRGSSLRYQPLTIRKRHRSPVPGLVGLCLMLVQLILLVRVICVLFDVVATTLWLHLLFVAGDVLVEPLRWLAANIDIAPLAGTQLLIYLEYLLAILAYGIFSRLLVGLLNALFRN